MTATSKHFVLLDAYCELTEKETFCLGEGNLQGVLKAQAKKGQISEELTRLSREAPLDPESKEKFDKTVRELLVQEEANNQTIEKLIRENRAEFKELSKQGYSANKFRRAYGMGDDDKSSSLKGKA